MRLANCLQHLSYPGQLIDQIERLNRNTHMPLTREMIASCFKVGDEFYSESRGSRYVLDSIEPDCVRITPDKGAQVRLNISALSIVYSNLRTIDLSNISARVYELLLANGITETSRETQIFPFAKNCSSRVVRLRSDRAKLLANAPLPEEVQAPQTLVEGASTLVTINAYERNPVARTLCIEHYGAVCTVCGCDFGLVYGPDAVGFIHVHHLRPLAEIGTEYEVDPIADLRPVCPNCHAVIHLGGRMRTIDEVTALLAVARELLG